MEEPKKTTKGKKKEKSGMLHPFPVSVEELYSILEPIEGEKRGALYCQYHSRIDHYTMDCYALRNIFHDKVAKGDLVIKKGKCTNQRMRRPEMAMTFFIGCDDLIEEEAENMASSSVAPTPL